MDASAVRFAWTDVTPNVIPSTATTRSVEATKILAVRPNAGLVAFASGIGGVVASVLVAMGFPLVAAGIQRNLQVLLRGSGGDVLDDFAGNALVPDVQAIAPGGHVVDGETAVVARLRVVPVLHDKHVGHHTRVDVAVHSHQTRVIERMALGFAPTVQPQVEAVGIAHREDVVIEGIVIRKSDGRADR